MITPEGQAHVEVTGGSQMDAIEAIFTYHAPTGDQPEKYKRIRSAAMDFARVLWSETPPGPDRTAALRKIREAVMTANAGIATNNAAALLR